MCSCAGPGRADALLYVQLDNKNVVMIFHMRRHQVVCERWEEKGRSPSWDPGFGRKGIRSPDVPGQAPLSACTSE